LTANWMNQFTDFFPGSKTPLNFEETIKETVKGLEDWDSKPHIMTMNGKEMEFFTIGQLGKALGNRSPNTLRKWEREGTMPRSFYVKASDDPRGRRRMYSRAMVEGMVRIAKEEGVFWPAKGSRLSETKFTERVVILFQSLRSSR
jgi:hypothetical protein